MPTEEIIRLEVSELPLGKRPRHPIYRPDDDIVLLDPKQLITRRFLDDLTGRGIEVVRVHSSDQEDWANIPEAPVPEPRWIDFAQFESSPFPAKLREYVLENLRAREQANFDEMREQKRYRLAIPVWAVGLDDSFEPIGQALHQAGIRNPNLLNPLHAWKLRKALVPYGKWYVGRMFSGRPRTQLPPMPASLERHARFALDALAKSPDQISATMRKHQLKLADRQCRMAELSLRVQDLITILVVSLHAAQSAEELVPIAADVLCQDLMRKITGKLPSDAYYRTVTRLGESIAEGGYEAIAGIEAEEILMANENDAED